ncbi:MAG: hypothetical protein WCF85_01940 [Rhodospirillaceae bacterium]
MSVFPQACARIEAMVRRFAGALLETQITLPDSFESLDALPELAAIRSGVRRLEAGRVTRHPRIPGLVKVGLSGDRLPDAAALAETLARRQGQRDKHGVVSKVRRYLLAPDRHKLARIIGYFGSRRRRRFAPPFGAPTAATDKDWALVPGVNFLQGEDGRWRCSDDGAIYETHLTTRSQHYPSQVGTDLYTNSCAAALFRFMQERTGDAVWRRGLEGCARYFAALPAHPRQRLESDHREFDYGPVRLALGAEAAARFAGWVDYDPVNVYGLRWFNEALIGGEDRKRRAVILGVLEANQTADGLLRDNFSGNAAESTDLTYHQYALAMLCLGNARLREPRADRIIERALGYSLDQLLVNGEATYYGRGANNIYHLASLAAALCYGAGVLGRDTGVALLSVLTRLEAFQDADGLWPTAMNRCDRDGMTGWHGSNCQYGALSAFLLAEGWQLLAGDLHGAVRPLSPAGSATACHQVLRADGQADGQADGIELALTGGGGPIPWSQGLHCSGFAGLTAFTFGGRNLLLTNDGYTERNKEMLLVADIPDQTPLDRRKLTRTDGGAELEITGPRLRGRYAYRLEQDGFTVAVHGVGRVRHGLALIGCCRIVTAEPNAVTVCSDAGFTLTASADRRITATLVPVPVNPQGLGTLLRLESWCVALDIRYRFTV